jgi:hypothetical protein
MHRWQTLHRPHISILIAIIRHQVPKPNRQFCGGNVPEFISLTDSCVKGSPRWARLNCDDAVNEILKR